MGWVGVVRDLPVRPSPGANRPAIDMAMTRTFQSALTTLTPCLHFRVYEAARVGGRPVGRYGDYRLGLYKITGDIPVSIPYRID
jgi:hypothetical protein